MQAFEGYLHKMLTELQAGQVEYQLQSATGQVRLNDWLGEQIRIEATGAKQCQGCQRLVPKFFQQGYCYPCSRSKAACDLCIVKPERCHFHLGTCREPDWGMAHCMQPHIIYLANASGLKVGITRRENVPTRFIDQGAVQALPLFEVSSRYHSGLIEILLARHLSDKTNWRKMLQGTPVALDLQQEAQTIKAIIAEDLAALVAQAKIELTPLDVPVINLEFPVLQYPLKIASFNLERQPVIEDRLLGIKGQYLLFQAGVLNIRSFSGYAAHIAFQKKTTAFDL